MKVRVSVGISVFVGVGAGSVEVKVDSNREVAEGINGTPEASARIEIDVARTSSLYTPQADIIRMIKERISALPLACVLKTRYSCGKDAILLNNRIIYSL